MDTVFLVYGLAFLAMGLVLIIWPKHDSRFELSSLSGWLAAFALVHGALEWMDLWRVVRGDNPGLAALRPFVLLASYLLLYEFGRRLVAASLLTGAGFLLYCAKRIQPTLEADEFRPVWRACVVAGGAFIAYGVFGGLVVQRADWAPAAWLNQDTFLAASGIPVQLLRAACAVTAAFSVTYILRIFHLERGQRLRVALEQADRLGRHNRLLLESVGEGIFGIDHLGRATFINPAALTMLGYTATELIGESMHALTHHSHADGRHFPREECPTHRTLRDGQTRHVDIDHFWRKDGSHFPVEYYTAQIREQGEAIGAVVVFQDASERQRIETELERYRLRLEDLVAQRTAELQELEQRSRLILDASANGLYGIDTAGRIILETSVERARVCGFRVGWQGETTQRAGARKAEQRGQAARKPCNRARSGVTQWVSAIGATNVSIHAASQGIRSGQLRFLGSSSSTRRAAACWATSRMR
jgi:PAS domain S-box-containing protein